MLELKEIDTLKVQGHNYGGKLLCSREWNIKIQNYLFGCSFLTAVGSYKEKKN